MGWQPFCFVECFDNIYPICLCTISYISIFNVYYNDYMQHTYILKYTINYGDLLSVCDICILLYSLTAVETRIK